MTDALLAWINIERDKAVRYLLENGFIYHKYKEFYWITKKFKETNFELRINLPDLFPVEYPKFFVGSTDWFLKYPHIERYKSKLGEGICHVDNDEKVPVFDGAKLIENELNKVLSIIKDYESGSFNTDEFLDEFNSYWGDEHVYLDLLNETYEPRLFDILTVKYFKTLITTEISETRIMLSNLGLEIEKERKILFLPLTDKFRYPFPRTESAMLALIESAGFRELLNQSIKRRSYYVIFSFNIGEHLHYGACKFSKLINSPFVKSKLTTIMVSRIDRARVFSRGGNKAVSSISQLPIKIAIVGCGSLGSSLALKLAKSGVRNFLLIDPDSLKVDNIGRHICGMKYIGQKKVNALKQFLLEQLPDLKISTETKNATECLEELSNSNLIISAVGSEGESFEHLVTQLKLEKNKLLTIPVIFTWFDSGVAGKVMLVKDTDITDFSGFIKKIGVLEESKKEELVKLDVGCNSSYSPYAFIEAENTVLHAALLVTKYISTGGAMDEEVWTIYNDCEKYNEFLKEEYKGVDSYSITKKKLQNLL